MTTDSREVRLFLEHIIQLYPNDHPNREVYAVFCLLSEVFDGVYDILIYPGVVTNLAAVAKIALNKDEFDWREQYSLTSTIVWFMSTVKTSINTGRHVQTKAGIMTFGNGFPVPPWFVLKCKHEKRDSDERRHLG